MVVICLLWDVGPSDVVQEARGAADEAAHILDLVSGPLSGEDDGGVEVDEDSTLAVEDDVAPADIAVDNIILVQQGDGLEDVFENSSHMVLRGE